MASLDAGEVQVIRFDAARFAILAGIGVHGNKQVSLGFVGDFRAPFQRNERVILARKHDIRAGQSLLNYFAEAQRHVQAQIFFHQSRWPDRSGVVAAVSRVDHDSADLQSQRARQRMLPVARQFRRGGRPHFLRLIVGRFHGAAGLL